MLTTSLYLFHGVLYELLIGFYVFLVLFLSVLVIPTRDKLSWPALWSTLGAL